MNYGGDIGRGLSLKDKESLKITRVDGTRPHLGQGQIWYKPTWRVLFSAMFIVQLAQDTATHYDNHIE